MSAPGPSKVGGAKATQEGDFSPIDTKNDDGLDLLAHIGKNEIAFWNGQVTPDARICAGPCVGRSDRICLPA